MISCFAEQPGLLDPDLDETGQVLPARVVVRSRLRSSQQMRRFQGIFPGHWFGFGPSVAKVQSSGLRRR
jgi:hypothetical protein